MTVFFRDLRKKDKTRFSNLILNEESYEKIMDFLSLRMLKVKGCKPHILENYAKYKMELDDIWRKCLKRDYYKDFNNGLIKLKNKIVKQREKELNGFSEQIDNSEICFIIEKHNRNISDANDLIKDNEELRQYGQGQVLNTLINKLNIFNDDLKDLIEEAIGGISLFNYVKDQVKYDMRCVSLSELALQQEKQEFLEEYKKNSLENQDKVKNESEVFWPIDSNGKEIMWENCPIVMIKNVGELSNCDD